MKLNSGAKIVHLCRKIYLKCRNSYIFGLTEEMVVFVSQKQPSHKINRRLYHVGKTVYKFSHLIAIIDLNKSILLSTIIVTPTGVMCLNEGLVSCVDRTNVNKM